MKTLKLSKLLIVILSIITFCFPCLASENELRCSDIKTLSGKKISKSYFNSFLDKEMESLNIKGISLAIINDGKIVYHKARGIADVYKESIVNNNSIFEAASLSKPVFAFFVMKQVEKGLIDLDTPLYKYLPYPDIEHDDRYKLITARHALSHTTGFPNWRWQNKDRKLDIKFKPGLKFSYSGEAYMYLAKVLAHLNKVKISELDTVFQKDIAKPLELEHFNFTINKYIANNLVSGHDEDKVVFDNYLDRKGFHSAGGLYSESINFSKFLIALMNYKGLKSESFREMLKKQVEIPKGEQQGNNFIVTHYTLGFAIKPSEYGPIYSHGGNNWGYTASFEYNKEKKFGYVFFTNANQCNDLNKKFQKLLLK